MSAVEGSFFRAGADGTLLEDFRALVDARRYPEKQALVPLARFIVGSGGGPNKDSPLFELCHLVYGVNKLLGAGWDHRAVFFLGLERVTSHRIHSFLETDGLKTVQGPVNVSTDGIRVEYQDENFQVKFGRMPFLIALYEFLASMEGFTFYQEMKKIFDDMAEEDSTPTLRLIKNATNKLASQLRQYRRAHMVWSANDEKFDRILPFLQERVEDNQLTIDDSVILEFWLLHSQGKDFKGYKTVFDAFVTFQRALQIGTRTQAAETATVMGADREAGEVDVSDQMYDLGAFGDWTSPLDVLDEDELKGINFLKRASERNPIEMLMHYGPDAIKLPLAFLRLESYGSVQTAITNDLQVKRGRESVERRISCVDAEPYSEKLSLYCRISEHVRTLQKAALHAIVETRTRGESKVVGFPDGDLEYQAEPHDDAVADEAREAFQSLTRKGFEEILKEDDERGDAFRQVVGPLVTVGHVLQGIIDKGDKMDRNSPKLDELFADDREIFSAQFARIYSGGNHEQV